MTGNTWTELSDGAVDQSSPVTDVLMTALRDNPKAIAERAANAPIVRIAQPVFLTGSGNWVVPVGVTAFKVTAVGGGGGGGGGNTAFGGGGQSGSVCVKWYNGVSAGASYAYSVGGGGAGGGGAGNGGTGTDTIFDTLTAYGGGGGTVNGGTVALSCAPGSKPATGDFSKYGEMPSGPAGGSGQFGVGGYNPALNESGTVGSGYGAGGGGAKWVSGDADSGAAGSAGTIIIEY